MNWKKQVGSNAFGSVTGFLSLLFWVGQIVGIAGIPSDVLTWVEWMTIIPSPIGWIAATLFCVFIYVKLGPVLASVISADEENDSYESQKRRKDFRETLGVFAFLIVGIPLLAGLGTLVMILATIAVNFVLWLFGLPPVSL
ncbi:MAG: hypothetical protein OXI17_01475 [Gammaproteobacteria bacterium]|nr:hypothetical protein [Gammaproteobacteria bacterium]